MLLLVQVPRRAAASRGGLPRVAPSVKVNFCRCWQGANNFRGLTVGAFVRALMRSMGLLSIAVALCVTSAPTFTQAEGAARSAGAEWLFCRGPAT